MVELDDRVKGAAYVRMARCDDPAEMDRRERRLLELAEEKSVNVVTIRREVAPGCGGIENRPVLGTLLEEVSAGAYDALLVEDATRFARGDKEAANRVLDALRRSGTKVLTPLAEYSPAERDDIRFLETALFAPSAECASGKLSRRAPEE